MKVTNTVSLAKTDFKVLTEMIQIINAYVHDAEIDCGAIRCQSPQGPMIEISYKPAQNISLNISNLNCKASLFNILLSDKAKKSTSDDIMISWTNNDKIIFTDPGKDLSITTPSNAILTGAYTLTAADVKQRLDDFNSYPVICEGNITDKMGTLSGFAKALGMYQIDLMKVKNDMIFRMGDECTAVVQLLQLPINPGVVDKIAIDTDTKCDHLLIGFTDVSVVCSLKTGTVGHLISCKWECDTETGIHMTVINESPAQMLR
jgi:ethanolamine utilization microcompartment shell protein EutS